MLILLILNCLGAIALFLFGMKLMSNAVQRVSNSNMRALLNKMTSDKFRSILAGIGLTTFIQSSSAVSLFTLSLVNANLINLLRAFSIVVGANIGTTLTLWIISLGFEINLNTICLPLLAIALPSYFSVKQQKKHWATIVIGFCLIFIALGLLNETFSEILSQNDFISPLNNIQNSNVLYWFGFLIVGLLVTIILQSSSASTSLVLILLAGGLPFELAVSMVIGANIGTTSSALIGSFVGNKKMKAVAIFHSLFNIVGALLFFPFIGVICDFIDSETLLVDNFVRLAAVHTVFNIVTAIIFIPFIEKFANYFSARIIDEDEEPKLQMLHSAFTASPDMYVLEANKKMIVLAGTTKRIIHLMGRMITESDEVKFQELHLRIKELENENDEMEEDIVNYLNQVYSMELSGGTSKKVNNIIFISQQLENIGDLAIKTAYTHVDRRNSNSYITPKLRTYMVRIQDALSSATTHLLQVLNQEESVDNITIAVQFESLINTIHDESMAYLIKTATKGKITPVSALYFKEIIQNYEIIGDHIFKAQKALER